MIKTWLRCDLKHLYLKKSIKKSENVKKTYETTVFFYDLWANADLWAGRRRLFWVISELSLRPMGNFNPYDAKHAFVIPYGRDEGPNTPHHQSQRTGHPLRRGFKAHIWTWYPMAYIMMVVRLNRQSVRTTPNPHWIPIRTHPSHNRYPAPRCREKNNHLHVHWTWV